MEKNFNDIVVFAEDDKSESAQLLAQRLGLEFVCERPEKADGGLALCMNKEGLSLVGEGLRLYGDFTRLIPRIKQNNLNAELLIKAAKIKALGENPTAVDATAGLGEDSFLLAAAGVSVRLYEYNPIIAALLSDALERAAEVPQLAEIAARMELFRENSIDALPKLPFVPDLILLDPMFPARQKSALVKKKLQVIQQFEMPCSNEKALIDAAISAKPKKIIIKRPAGGAYLAEVKPSYSIGRKSIRYDCLVLS